MRTAPAEHRGSVLPLALVFALLLAMLAATVVETSALQFHMAGNHQMQEAAALSADAVASELSGNLDNFDLGGPVGQRNCATLSGAAGCDLYTLPDNPGAAPAPAYDLQYAVIRQHPLLLQAARGAGAATEDFALFEIEVRVDGSAGNLGSAMSIHGVAVPLAGGLPLPVYWREPGIDPL